MERFCSKCDYFFIFFLNSVFLIASTELQAETIFYLKDRAAKAYILHMHHSVHGQLSYSLVLCKMITFWILPNHTPEFLRPPYVYYYVILPLDSTGG